MRKLLFTVAFAVIGFTASYAQKAERQERAARTERVKLSAEERAEKSATALQQKLSLNNEQKSKIKQIELERAMQQEQWHKKDSDAIKGKFEERKAAMKAHQDKIDAVLTAEQKTKLAASREDAKAKMKDRAKNRKGKNHKAPKADEGKI